MRWDLTTVSRPATSSLLLEVARTHPWSQTLHPFEQEIICLMRPTRATTGAKHAQSSSSLGMERWRVPVAAVSLGANVGLPVVGAQQGSHNSAAESPTESSGGLTPHSSDEVEQSCTNSPHSRLARSDRSNSSNDLRDSRRSAAKGQQIDQRHALSSNLVQGDQYRQLQQAHADQSGPRGAAYAVLVASEPQHRIPFAYSNGSTQQSQQTFIHEKSADIGSALWYPGRVEGQQLNGPGRCAAVRGASMTAVASASSKAVLGHSTDRPAAFTGLQPSEIRKEAIGSLAPTDTAWGNHSASNQGLRHLGTAVARQETSTSRVQTTLGATGFVPSGVIPNAALQSAGQAKLEHPTHRADQASSPRGLTVTSIAASSGREMSQPSLMGTQGSTEAGQGMVGSHGAISQPMSMGTGHRFWQPWSPQGGANSEDSGSYARIGKGNSQAETGSSGSAEVHSFDAGSYGELGSWPPSTSSRMHTNSVSPEPFDTSSSGEMPGSAHSGCTIDGEAQDSAAMVETAAIPPQARALVMPRAASGTPMPRPGLLSTAQADIAAAGGRKRSRGHRDAPDHAASRMAASKGSPQLGHRRSSRRSRRRSLGRGTLASLRSSTASRTGAVSASDTGYDDDDEGEAEDQQSDVDDEVDPEWIAQANAARMPPRKHRRVDQASSTTSSRPMTRRASAASSTGISTGASGSARVRSSAASSSGDQSAQPSPSPAVPPDSPLSYCINDAGREFVQSDERAQHLLEGGVVRMDRLAIRGRKSRGDQLLPEAAVLVLLGWICRHVENPYPALSTKEQLAKDTGLPVDSVKNYLTNLRKRHLNPLKAGRPPRNQMEVDLLTLLRAKGVAVSATDQEGKHG